MVRRVGIKEKVIFAGGVAQNECLRQLLSDKLDMEITIPKEPQIVGAFGAALLAKHGKKQKHVVNSQINQHSISKSRRNNGQEGW